MHSLTFSGLSLCYITTTASPEVGLISVEIILIVVVLPAPFGPINANISPSSILNETPSAARTF